MRSDDFNRCGFTLTEIIVSMVLLTAIVGALYSAFVSAHKLALPEIQRGFESTEIAREKLEYLYDYVDQSLWNLAGQPLSHGTTSETVTRPDGRDYTRETTVSTLAGKDYRKVAVKVTMLP